MSRLRIFRQQVCSCFGAAALLAAVAVNPKPPKLPWAVPTVTISEVDAPGSAVTGVAVDAATNTIYVASLVAGDQITNNTIAVIDGSRCSAMNASHCNLAGATDQRRPCSVLAYFRSSNSNALCD